MKIRDYRAYFIEMLAPVYDAVESESFFYMILAHKKQMKRIDLALNPGIDLTEKELEDFNSILEKLKSHVPIQYVIGKANFYGLELEVSPSVLIPRPETEELVQWIVESNNKMQRETNFRILDIGTGSGCIAIALDKNIPNAGVSAIDVSGDALAIAKKNAKINTANVNFTKIDILKAKNLPEMFDIIVSNPPYVRDMEKIEIRKNVLDFEPHLALFVDDDDPLIFYRKITDLAMRYLKPNGQLYFEINQYLAKDVMDLLETSGFQSIELRNDIYGNSRMVRAVVQGM